MGKSLDITEMLLHHSLAKHSGSHPLYKHTSCQGMHVFWGLEYVGKVSGYHAKQTHQQPQHLDYENETAQHL